MWTFLNQLQNSFHGHVGAGSVITSNLQPRSGEAADSFCFATFIDVGDDLTFKPHGIKSRRSSKRECVSCAELHFSGCCCAELKTEHKRLYGQSFKKNQRS